MKLLSDDGLPMMSEREIEIVKELLDKNKSRYCLEWGSGNSSVYFPSKCADIKSWLAIEHKIDYYELLVDKLPLKAKIKVIKDKECYINYPIDLGIKYDFILVDGLYRDKCMQVALKIVDKEGIILLHDCDREASADMMKKYKHKKLTDGKKLLNNGYYAHRGLAVIKH